MECECRFESKIHEMDKELAVAKKSIKTIESDIGEINDSIQESRKWTKGIMATGIVTLVTVIIGLLDKF